MQREFIFNGRLNNKFESINTSTNLTLDPTVPLHVVAGTTNVYLISNAGFQEGDEVKLIFKDQNGSNPLVGNYTTTTTGFSEVKASNLKPYGMNLLFKDSIWWQVG